MAKKRQKEKNDLSDEIKDIQTKEENKILRSILIIIFFIILGFILFVFISNSLNKFEYRGVKFNIVKFCDAGPPCLVTYRTSLPVKISGNSVVLAKPAEKTNDYSFYLRNDPRKLNVSFNGEIVFKENTVLNFEKGAFICEGNGAIAAANLIQLYKLLGVNLISDENASCDQLGRYTLINVLEGNETKIEYFRPACYEIKIKDCEILEGTEKFMIETFVKINKILNNQTS